MRKRKGQALIIVVIIIAIVMAVFANSLTTAMRYHAREETEIYQREQALYLAEMGINQMLFNMNNGTTYIDGDQISGNAPSGIGRYTTTYHTPDNSGFHGTAYIKSTGMVNGIERTIYSSIGSSSSDAFKYCLFTSTGGPDGVVDDSYFTNPIYGNAYKYNTNTSSTPYPDTNYYSQAYAEKYKAKNGSNPKYKIKAADLGKVLYIHTTDSNATLTVSFVNIYDESYSLSIITDAKNVIFDKMGPANGNDTNWSGAENSNDNNLIYPIVTHLGTGYVEFNFTYSYDGNTTLKLNGFLYTAGYIDMEYSYTSYGEINGEVIEQDPQGYLGGPYGDTNLNYTTDYFTNPPPHFIVPNSKTSVIPGSFREEY